MKTMTKKKWRERHGCDESGKKGGSVSLSTFEEENGHLPQVEVDEMPEKKKAVVEKNQDLTFLTRKSVIFS
jgi:hypothetical protein